MLDIIRFILIMTAIYAVLALAVCHIVGDDNSASIAGAIAIVVLALDTLIPERKQ